MLVASLITGVRAVAQTRAAGNKPAAEKPKRIFMPQAYLGNTNYKGGALQKDVLGGLLKERVTSRDSLGNSYKVVGFEFVYAERMLYEDSVGNLLVEFDYLSEYCPGDTLSAGIKSSIFDRIKEGDTAYFNRIDVLKTSPGQSGGDIIMGKGMKFAVIK